MYDDIMPYPGGHQMYVAKLPLTTTGDEVSPSAPASPLEGGRMYVIQVNVDPELAPVEVDTKHTLAFLF